MSRQTSTADPVLVIGDLDRDLVFHVRKHCLCDVVEREYINSATLRKTKFSCALVRGPYDLASLRKRAAHIRHLRENSAFPILVIDDVVDTEHQDACAKSNVIYCPVLEDDERKKQKLIASIYRASRETVASVLRSGQKKILPSIMGSVTEKKRSVLVYAENGSVKDELSSYFRVNGWLFSYVDEEDDLLFELNNNWFHVALVHTSLDERNPNDLCRKIKELNPFTQIALFGPTTQNGVDYQLMMRPVVAASNSPWSLSERFPILSGFIPAHSDERKNLIVPLEKLVFDSFIDVCTYTVSGQARLNLLCGPSACGKTTVAEGVANKLPIHREISHTTRPPRKGETDGVDHYFITDKKIAELENSGDFICYEYRGYAYALDISSIATKIEENIDVLLTVTSPEVFLQIKDSGKNTNVNKKYAKMLGDAYSIYVGIREDDAELRRIKRKDTSRFRGRYKPEIQEAMEALKKDDDAVPNVANDWLFDDHPRRKRLDRDEKKEMMQEMEKWSEISDYCDDAIWNPDISAKEMQTKHRSNLIGQVCKYIMYKRGVF